MLRGLIEIYKIMSWHKKTFPKFSAEGQKKKVRDEAGELIEAFEKFTNRKKTKSDYLTKKVNEEMADVIIASINAMRFEDVRQEVNKKMKENYKRSWENGQHKR